MSALGGRVRKLEVARGGMVGVTDEELAEANSVIRRQVRLLLSEVTETAEGQVWEPTAAERVEIEELRGKMEWAQGVCRRHWEHRNPGREYDAHCERERQAARERIQECFSEYEAAGAAP